MKRIYLYLVLLLIFHLFFLVNLQFTAWPEIFSFPYLLNNDFSLYKDFVHAYPPLLTVMLSWIYQVFGYNINILKVFTWGLILVNDLLIFAIALKVTKKYIAGILSVLLYVFIQPFLEGNMLWFDLGIVPFVLAGIYFATSFLEDKANKNLIFSSLLFTLAVLVKQTALIFPFAFFLILIFQKSNFKKLIIFLLTPSILVVPLITKLFLNGEFQSFWNWVLYYPSQFWTKFPGYVQLGVARYQLFILLLIFTPLLLIIFQRKFFNLINNLLILSFVTSLITFYPRFSFFHLQISIALGALLLGIILNKQNKILIAGILLIWCFFIQRPVIARDWGKDTRFYSKEDLVFSELIKQKTKPEEKIYFLGPHSGNYVTSSRLPAKPWIDNFGWAFEIPGVQEGMFERWKSDPPKVIFWQKPSFGNWYDLGVYQPKLVVEYIKANYNNEGEIYKNIELWRRN